MCKGKEPTQQLLFLERKRKRHWILSCSLCLFICLSFCFFLLRFPRGFGHVESFGAACISSVLSWRCLSMDTSQLSVTSRTRAWTGKISHMSLLLDWKPLSYDFCWCQMKRNSVCISFFFFFTICNLFYLNFLSSLLKGYLRNSMLFH